jgi:hypothetical protein
LLPRLFWRAARIGGVWVYALVAGPLTIDVTSTYFRGADSATKLVNTSDDYGGMR